MPNADFSSIIIFKRRKKKCSSLDSVAATVSVTKQSSSSQSLVGDNGLAGIVNI